MKLNLLLPALLLTLLASCSSVPNATRSETDMKNFLEAVSKKDIELIQFQKKDGLKREEFGVKYYDVAFEATIKYNAKGYFRKSALFGSSDLNYIFAFHRGTPVIDGFSYSYYVGRVIGIEKNDRLKIEGHITYFKSDKGWNIEKIIINKYQETNS
jgi:hypothetical protein